VCATQEWKSEVLRSRLGRLTADPRSAQVFGFSGHNFALLPPVSDGAISRVELNSGFFVAAAYRLFVTVVSNGGPGPGYGLFPFGRCGNSARENEPWTFDTLGDPSRPFPHTGKWNLEHVELVPPVDLTDDQMDAWFEVHDRRYFDPGLVSGSIPIGHFGCAMWVRLVVAGPEAGNVWLDDRASNGGIVPLDPPAFQDWYLKWLSETETVVLGEAE
jgi:hypothetical protein